VNACQTVCKLILRITPGTRCHLPLQGWQRRSCRNALRRPVIRDATAHFSRSWTDQLPRSGIRNPEAPRRSGGAAGAPDRSTSGRADDHHPSEESL